MVLHSGDQLEVVSRMKKEVVHSCQIIDQGLPGLQHSFSYLKKRPAVQPLANWERQYTRLSSQWFWSYEPLEGAWGQQDTPLLVSCHSVLRMADVPLGGVGVAQNPEDEDPLASKTSECRQTRARNISGKCIRQHVKTKLDFMTMQQAAKRANKTDEIMFLCVLWINSLPDQGKKRKHAKT